MPIYKDMEKPTCDTVQFFAFTKIGMEYQLQKKFFHKECKLEQLKYLDSKQPPEWVKEKRGLSRIYDNLIVLDTETLQGKEILTSYFQGFSFPNGKTGADYFKSESLKEHLLYDFKLKSFMHSIEFSFALPEITEKKAVILKDSQGNEVDFYNCVRNAIVDTGENQNRQFIEHSQNASYKTIKEVVHSVYQLQIPDLITRINSGNITVVTVHDGSQEMVEESLLETNKLAERIEYFNDLIHLNDCTCSFNGRFQTIITQKRDKQFHFLPITYQAQFVWSYLDTMEELIENLNVERQGYKQFTLTENHKGLISSMVEKIQILSYQNEIFKKSIENEYDLVYKKFEFSWQLETTMLAKKEFIAHLNDYLSRVQMEESEELAEKQNKILYIISLLQVLAFISIWGDFLSLISDYGGPAIDMEEISHTIGLVNTTLPLVLIGVSCLLLVVGFKSKK
ncbi:MAG: hypothetical protein R3Y63_07435 [Eubacteriales bacterium]